MAINNQRSDQMSRRQTASSQQRYQPVVDVGSFGSPAQDARTARAVGRSLGTASDYMNDRRKAFANAEYDDIISQNNAIAIQKLNQAAQTGNTQARDQLFQSILQSGKVDGAVVSDAYIQGQQSVENAASNNLINGFYSFAGSDNQKGFGGERGSIGKMRERINTYLESRSDVSSPTILANARETLFDDADKVLTAFNADRASDTADAKAAGDLQTTGDVGKALTRFYANTDGFQGIDNLNILTGRSAINTFIRDEKLKGRVGQEVQKALMTDLESVLSAGQSGAVSLAEAAKATAEANAPRNVKLPSGAVVAARPARKGEESGTGLVYETPVLDEAGNRTGGVNVVPVPGGYRSAGDAKESTRLFEVNDPTQRIYGDFESDKAGREAVTATRNSKRELEELDSAVENLNALLNSGEVRVYNTIRERVAPFMEAVTGETFDTSTLGANASVEEIVAVLQYLQFMKPASNADLLFIAEAIQGGNYKSARDRMQVVRNKGLGKFESNRQELVDLGVTERLIPNYEQGENSPVPEGFQKVNVADGTIFRDPATGKMLIVEDGKAVPYNG